MLACQGNGQISQFGYLLIPLQPITAEPCIGQVLSAVVRGSDGPAGQVIIAYEPFWTIGALQPAPSAYVADVCQRVRIALADQLSDFALVYGGSAGPGLLTALGANVDGLFLGRFAHDPGAVAEVLSEATLPRWTGTHRRT
jgi:triosephosphate isomerase